MITLTPAEVEILRTYISHRDLLNREEAARKIADALWEQGSKPRSAQYHQEAQDINSIRIKLYGEQA